jgi:hypothetical protein
MESRMRAAKVSVLGLLALVGMVAVAEARQCRCGRTIELQRVYYYRAVPVDFYRGPASDYAAWYYRSRGGIGPASRPQQYATFPR